MAGFRVFATLGPSIGDRTGVPGERLTENVYSRKPIWGVGRMGAERTDQLKQKFPWGLGEGVEMCQWLKCRWSALSKKKKKKVTFDFHGEFERKMAELIFKRVNTLSSL